MIAAKNTTVAEPSRIQVWPIVATVASGTHARPNGQPEPVWLVRTTGGFDIEAIIAQSDRLAIEVTTGQGGPGSSMTERWTRTEAP